MSIRDDRRRRARRHHRRRQRRRARARQRGLRHAWIARLAALGLLLVGCAPPFDYYDCTDLCRPCEIVDCGQFCGRLDDAHHLDACAPGARVAWACTSAIGCDFPLQCRPSLTEVRECLGH